MVDLSAIAVAYGITENSFYAISMRVAGQNCLGRRMDIALSTYKPLRLVKTAIHIQPPPVYPLKPAGFMQTVAFTGDAVARHKFHRGVRGVLLCVLLHFKPEPICLRI
jgi:hypothetical protein